MKVKKVVLYRYDAESNSWVAFFPAVDGGNVYGTVEDSNKLGGKDPDKYYSQAPVIKLTDENGDPSLLITGRVVVSNNEEDENKAEQGDVFVSGNIYVNDGQRVATMSDVTNIEARLRNVVVNQAIEANRLATPVRINKVLFDGSQDITISMFIVSPTAPSDTSKLWVDSSEHTLCYYDGIQWTPIVGVWG